MSIFKFFGKKRTNKPIKTELTNNNQNNLSISIQYKNTKIPSTKIKTQIGTIKNDLEIEYVRLSTSGDENVCPMCAQFEGKIFLVNDAPKLPLCPSCACDYERFFKEELPSNAIISNKNDFVLPAECTSLFFKHQRTVYDETDISKQIRLCESDLKKLPEFMAPYISADFPAPVDLACRDLLPTLYMQLGQWNKAKNAIEKCIIAKAYYPEDSSEILIEFESYRKVATETLTYISQNPGCLQRNIYKKMAYDGKEKELLKDFLRHSKLIKKVKYNNTNQLFCNAKTTNGKAVYNTPTLVLQKNCLYTKWGIYEMPEPYKLNLTKGPRKDLKEIAKSCHED